MAIVTKFCFSCSVRSGSVIIGVFTLIQATIFLIVTLMGANSLDSVSETVNDWITTIELEGNFYKNVANNPKILITVMSTFFLCLICSSVFLLYGCVQCKPTLMYPFVFFYLIYIFGLFAVLLLLILFVKVRGNGLGDLIFYSNLGGFILLYYFYTWACVVSLIQIIKELQFRLRQKLKVAEKMKIAKKVNKKGSYNYANFN